MKLERQSFLVLERLAKPPTHKVRIVQTLGEALLEWKPSMRVSPIFEVSPSPIATNASLLRGHSWFVFVGPVHPDALSWVSPKKTKLWVSLGLLNVLLMPDSAQDVEKILGWAGKNKLLHEAWELVDGVVKNVVLSRSEAVSPEFLKGLADLSGTTLPPELSDAVSEYCPLMASTMTRGSSFPNEMLLDLRQINKYVADTIRELKDGRKDVTPYRVLGQLLSVNAGLSRFSSQTFAGTSPIAETECHFWSNSLLGIGIATLGLWHLNSFLEETLGKARIPERFARLRKHRDAVPDLTRLDVNDRFWSVDHIGQIDLSADGYEPLIPPLTYFSGRDGFKSTSTTLSAPLACVSSCNSPRWSLLTLTHEVSHTIIRTVASELYPNLDERRERIETIKLLERKRGESLLEEIRRLLLVSIVRLDDVYSGRVDDLEIDEENLRGLIEHWQREVEEVLVHVFDFLYFYGKDVDRYITGIWTSWGTIPNINNRIRDYVVRSICTVLSIHLRRPKGEEAARDQVRSTLKKIFKETQDSYIEDALAYIRKHWDDEIRDRVLAHKGIVKIAQTFLFSKSVATALRREPEISGGAAGKGGYTLSPSHLELRYIRNPLHFLELYTTSKVPSPLGSAWIFYVLAFCVQFK
jgi:hypothetical protein